VNALFGDLVADLLYPMRHIFMLEDGWSDIQSILDLGTFENWQSMTMTAVCAHDDASLVEPLFKQQFGEHPLRTGLPSRHMSGGRLTRRYFFQDRATRAMRARRAEDGGAMQVRMHELDEEIDVSREIIHETYADLHKLVTDRIGGTDAEVEEYIDWQLARYLSGEASLEDVTATMTDTCDRMATASFGRLFAGEAE
jgi:hypothetical protein